MKIIERGPDYVYRFKCPCCYSKLEADRDELYRKTHLSNTAIFYCPVCGSHRYVDWDNVFKLEKI